MKQFCAFPFQPVKTLMALDVFTAAASGGKRHKARFRRKLVNRVMAKFRMREQLIWAIDNGMTHAGFWRALTSVCQRCVLNELQFLLDETRTLDAFADVYLTPVMVRVYGLFLMKERATAVEKLIRLHFGKSLRMRFTWLAVVVVLSM
jgi:hypothetical protein